MKNRALIRIPVSMCPLAAMLLCFAAALAGADEAPVVPAGNPLPAATPDQPGSAPTGQALPEPARQALRDRLDAAQQRFAGLMDEERPADAVPAGLEVAELTRQLYGDGSLRLATPVTNLATAQLRSGDLLGAESNFNTAVFIIERRDGIISPRLLNPLLGLGETYVRAEQYVQATEAYERALRVNHVNEGFYNLDQISIRDGLSEGYLGQRKLDKANFHQEAEVYVQSRKAGGTASPEMTAALLKLARWYDRTNQPEAARGAYQAAERSIELTRGPTDPAVVDALLAIAETYRLQSLLPPPPNDPNGQSPVDMLVFSSATLRKALAIVDQQPEPDPVHRAEVLVRMGDNYMMWDRRKNANERYAEAWRVLSKDEGNAALRDKLLGTPHRIMGPDPPNLFPLPSKKNPTPPRTQDLAPGYVLMRYTVDQAGRVIAANIVESDPANLIDDTMIRVLRGTLFRPRYAEGAPVPADGLTLRHEFRYSRQAAEKARPTAGPASGGKPLPEPGAGDKAPGEALPPPPEPN